MRQGVALTSTCAVSARSWPADGPLLNLARWGHFFTGRSPCSRRRRLRDSNQVSAGVRGGEDLNVIRIANLLAGANADKNGHCWIQYVLAFFALGVMTWFSLPRSMPAALRFGFTRRALLLGEYVVCDARAMASRLLDGAHLPHERSAPTGRPFFLERLLLFVDALLYGIRLLGSARVIWPGCGACAGSASVSAGRGPASTSGALVHRAGAVLRALRRTRSDVALARRTATGLGGLSKGGR
jgi:hypothetical protein